MGKFRRRIGIWFLTLAIVLVILPFTGSKVYAWEVTNVKLKEIAYHGNNIKTIDLAYSYPSESPGWSLCTCYVGSVFFIKK